MASSGYRCRANQQQLERENYRGLGGLSASPDITRRLRGDGSLRPRRRGEARRQPRSASRRFQSPTRGVDQAMSRRMGISLERDRRGIVCRRMSVLADRERKSHPTAWKRALKIRCRYRSDHTSRDCNLWTTSFLALCLYPSRLLFRTVARTPLVEANDFV